MKNSNQSIENSGIMAILVKSKKLNPLGFMTKLLSLDSNAGTGNVEKDINLLFDTLNNAFTKDELVYMVIAAGNEGSNISQELRDLKKTTPAATECPTCKDIKGTKDPMDTPTPTQPTDLNNDTLQGENLQVITEKVHEFIEAELNGGVVKNPNADADKVFDFVSTNFTPNEITVMATMPIMNALKPEGLNDLPESLADLLKQFSRN